MKSLRKFIVTIKLALSNHFAYRLNFLLEFFGPALIFYFISYNVWSSIYASSDKIEIQGYTLSQMLNYQAWVLIIALLSHSYRASDMAVDIRYGRISSYLLYPFNFWQYNFSNFIGFLIIQIFIVVFTILSLISLNVISIPTTMFLFLGVITSLVGAFFWYSYQYITGLLAFWLEETWVFRIIFLICTKFFSGAIIPLEFFPKWSVSLLNYTPFPYLTYYPVKILTEESPVSLIPISVLLVWIILLTLFSQILWKRGLKLYTAAGM